MSLYGADFIRQANKILYTENSGSFPDMHFQPHGYLYLASEEGAEIMQENHRIQM